MKSVSEIQFKRKFALNLYKNRKIPLGEMSLTQNFVGDKRGDPYPILLQRGTVQEQVQNGTYRVESGSQDRIVRLLGQYFPYASYEVKIDALDGACGFCVRGPEYSASVLVTVQNGALVLCLDAPSGQETVTTEKRFVSDGVLVATMRREKIDLYWKETGEEPPIWMHTFVVPEFAKNDHFAVFQNTVTGLEIRGNATVSQVSVSIDCGIAQADIRPIRYEDGSVLLENGKMYLSVSLRMQEDKIQGILSWVPGTAQFELTGVVFYDVGDGVWGNDVAASILYNRLEQRWNLWVCSFSHGHWLGCSAFAGDIRFGVNVVDLQQMEPMGEDDPDTAFLGKAGDEDPDFIFDPESGRWYMTICRLVTDESGTNYRYFLFESNQPLAGYRYVASSAAGSDTGGSILRVGDRYQLVCGSDFSLRAEYRVYTLPDFSSYEKLHCDYDDGGFRGWGTVFSVPYGGRNRWFWLTFDRHLASSYNWSYGNLYCFSDI